MASNVRTIFIFSGNPPTGITSGSFDLRVSPFSSTGIAGTHVANGIWVFTGIDDTAEYKLYNTAAGTEMTGLTGGGTNTRSFYDPALGNTVNITGSQTITGSKTLSGTTTTSGNLFVYAPLQHTSSTPYINGVPAFGNSLTWKDYVLGLFAGDKNVALIAEANVLIVDANRSADITGYVYNDIQTAINYANSQTPSATNQWWIYIVPHKSNSNYTGYVENLTVYKYVHLIGLGGKVMIKGTITYSGAWTGGTFGKMKNLVIRPTAGVNLTIRGWEAEDCEFLHEASAGVSTLNLENSQLIHCGFFGADSLEVDCLVATTNDNYMVLDCYGNHNITWGATEIVNVMNYKYNNSTSFFYRMV